MKKPETKYIFAIAFLIFVVLALLGFMYVADLKEKQFNEGYQSGINVGQLNVISQIQTTAKIPIVEMEGNDTVVNWYLITDLDICGGING